MLEELTNEEKMAIVNQHVKNVITNIYNLEVSLIAESSLESPSQDILNGINLQLEKEKSKKSALMAEYNILSGN